MNNFIEEKDGKSFLTNLREALWQSFKPTWGNYRGLFTMLGIVYVVRELLIFIGFF